MLFISILIGKTVMLVSRLFGRAGSALPGLIIQKLHPPFLKKTLQKLSGGVIIVTGTNGKTTTTKIISELLEAHGQRVLTNKTGSNFVRGIISTTVQNISLWGRLPYDIAVFEQDEAYAVHLVRQLKPSGVVALNVMRDQMDRFGEIDKTAELIGNVVAEAKDWVVLNANDPRLGNLKKAVKAPKIVWFGHSAELAGKFVSDDQLYSHDSTKYFKAGSIDVRLESLSAGKVKIKIAGKMRQFQTPLDGTHNGFNIAAALAVLEAVKPGADLSVTSKALSTTQPAFGRGEHIILKNGTKLRLQLVKNPASFAHALRMLKDDDFGVVGIAINDNHADGRDVSWLWDVDFSSLTVGSHEVICGGIRAYDMANRLKYDEVELKEVTPKFSLFLKHVRQAGNTKTPAVIFCTYTAMLRLRKMLKPYSRQMNKEGL